ncbi:hypothetical protein GYH30_048204 [Glycine max]|nr:hypothetical protein GYH30_048204 [Glycine max]
MFVDSPQQWSKWLPLAEWWYNTTFHSAIQTTPYEVVYGQPPPIHLHYLPGESKAYRQVSIAPRANEKLAPKYFGPYPVISRIGEVAYELKLPDHAKIHNVFHVSQLKKHIGQFIHSPTLPDFIPKATGPKEPTTILDPMILKRKGQAVTKVLVQWKHQLPEDWEFYYDLKRRFPQFDS